LEIINERIIVVLKSSIGVRKLATSIKSNVNIKPGIIILNDVTLLIGKTWTVTVNEGGVDDGGVGQDDWLVTTIQVEVGVIFLLEGALNLISSKINEIRSDNGKLGVSSHWTA
jgi:hypothetical protein